MTKVLKNSRLDMDDLEKASKTTLRVYYEQEFGCPPPKHASRGFILGNLCWNSQARDHCENPKKLRASLLAQSKPRRVADFERLQPGTRIVREWHGEVHEVTVSEQGYIWQGTTYRSLTAIAEHITGAGWSGPRFFGLKTKNTDNGRP